MDFPGGSDGKASAYNVGDPGSVPGLGRSPGEGNGNPLQYSCLENSMDREAWWATVHGSQLDTTEQLSVHTCMCVLKHQHLSLPKEMQADSFSYQESPVNMEY